MLDFERGDLVKICGLRTDDAARSAALAEADALGFILAESRRQIHSDTVRDIRASIAMVVERMPAFVGVTVNASPSELASLVEDASLDYVQLSGHEDPSLLAELDVPAIKTIHVETGMALDEVEREVEQWLDHPRPVAAVLIDAKVEGLYGGAGVRTDWSIAARIAERYPAILAGGLEPVSVGEAIRAVRPRGVDVSSGVEIAGAKDLALIEAFVAHARQGFDVLRRETALDS